MQNKLQFFSLITFYKRKRVKMSIQIIIVANFFLNKVILNAIQLHFFQNKKVCIKMLQFADKAYASLSRMCLEI